MPEERRLVTILFADVVGSTAIGSEHDPEVVRGVMSRYFARMKEIAETHGGTVEKFIGDAVMVVFGVPRLHDDDAERAVRSAVAMREAIERLNEDLAVRIETRMGVNTGEVVAAADAANAQFLVTGDVVNVAARLQQNAEPGEIVVGALTERLTRLAVDYDPRTAIAAKGKAEPLAAFRVARVRSAVPEQARGLPAFRAQLVGRQRELRLLMDTYERVANERRTHLFTIVGSPGVGKSRLTGEALARISGRGDVRVLRGRCLPYGAGITWWPIGEIVREDAGIASGDARDVALAKLDARLGEVMTSDNERRLVRPRFAVLLGFEAPSEALPGVAAEAVPREIALALRRYVEALGRRAPLVLVVDDLQWAEDAVVAAVEQIADRVTDVPLLLFCIARPELLELRAGWGGGKSNATLITLDPLSPDETRTLIARLLDVDDLPDALRQRVIERSEGNPLFCEEFLRMLIDEGRVVRDGDRWRATDDIAQVRVPETVQAVLGARLDRLAPDERRALQVASVIGERFGLEQVGLLGGVTASGDVFDRLLRKGLVSEDRESAEADAYKFKHLLVRDVAHATLAKAERAELHSRFATILEPALAAGREEMLPIVLHHVERAFTLAAELRQPKDVLGPRAKRVLELALAQADAALGRGDIRALGAAVKIARGALDAAGATPHQRLEIDLLDLRYAVLNEPYDVVLPMAWDLRGRALDAGESEIVARTTVEIIRAEVYGGEAEEGRVLPLISETAEIFERAGDVGGAVDVLSTRLDWYFGDGRLGLMISEGDKLIQRALAANDSRRAMILAARLAGAAHWKGDLPMTHRYMEQSDELARTLGVTGIVLWRRQAECRALWAEGKPEEAERLWRANRAEYEDLGYSNYAISALRSLCDLYRDQERWADLDATLEEALAVAERIGDRWNRQELFSFDAERAAARGDLARATESLAKAREFVRQGDATGEAAIATAAAAVAEAAGDEATAEARWREALARAAATDYAGWIPVCKLDLAGFLARRGRLAEAAQELAAAEEMLTRTGYHWRVKQRQRLHELLAAPAPAAPPSSR